MSTVDIQHKYVPRSQFLPFHGRHQRWSLIVAHRRAGKTVAVVNDLVVRALRTSKERAFYAYIAPTYGQAKNIAWVYIKEAVRTIPGTKISESDTSVTLPNGAKVRVFGVDNPDVLRGLYFDGVICDEFGEWDGRAWTEVIRPALADRKGWACFIGTPKGPSNKFAQMRDKAMQPANGWFYLQLKGSETGILPQDELDDLQADLEPEEYEQEIECSFQAAVKGSYYGKHMSELERHGSVREVDYDPTEPVSISLDIGYADATAIWFWQTIDGQVRMFDYFETTGMDAEECVELLQLKPYSYDTVWLPFDAVAKTFRSKKSVVDTFREFDLPARTVPKLDLKDGIDSVRKTLRTYPIVFDSVRTEGGLKCLRNYSRKWNKDNGVFSNTPDHNAWSHGADSFRYASLVINPTAIQNSLDRAQKKRATALADKLAGHLNTGSRSTRSSLNDAWTAYDKQRTAQSAFGQARI